MKKQILSFLFVLSAALLISTNAFAQPTAPGHLEASTRYANVGSSVTYTVNAGGVTTGFVWAIRQGTPHAAGSTTPTISSTSNVLTVDWTGTTNLDVYYLDVYYKDGSGCWSEMLTYQVTITDAALCIASGVETLNSITTADATVKETCSLIETNTVGNSSGTYGNTTTFYLTIKKALPNATYTVTYKIGAHADETTTIGTDDKGEGAKSISIDHTAYAAEFATNVAKNVTVLAKSMVASSNPLVTTSTCSFDIAVHAKPTINFVP